MTPWVRYSIIRIGLFAVLFALLMVTGIEWWISALVATVMAFSISYIFFVRQRDALARDLARLVERKTSSDEDAVAEDDAIASEGDGPGKS